MSLRDDLAGVLARDSRYTIQAYAFVFEALEHTKQLRRAARARTAPGGLGAQNPPATSRDESFAWGCATWALKQYGLLTITVLAQWGIRATSDVGEIVYNLIDSGDFEKTPGDARSDFDNVFDFDDAFRRSYVMALDDVA